LSFSAKHRYIVLCAVVVLVLGVAAVAVSWPRFQERSGKDSSFEGVRLPRNLPDGYAVNTSLVLTDTDGSQSYFIESRTGQSVNITQRAVSPNADRGGLGGSPDDLKKRGWQCSLVSLATVTASLCSSPLSTLRHLIFTIEDLDLTLATMDNIDQDVLVQIANAIINQ
jgi:hypothetical protein